MADIQKSYQDVNRLIASKTKITAAHVLTGHPHVKLPEHSWVTGQVGEGLKTRDTSLAGTKSNYYDPNAKYASMHPSVGRIPWLDGEMALVCYV